MKDANGPDAAASEAGRSRQSLQGRRESASYLAPTLSSKRKHSLAPEVDVDVWPQVNLRSPLYKKQTSANTRLSNSIINQSRNDLKKLNHLATIQPASTTNRLKKKNLQDIEERSNSQSNADALSTSRRIKANKLGNFAKPTKSFIQRTAATSSIVETLKDDNEVDDQLATIDVSLTDDKFKTMDMRDAKARASLLGNTSSKKSSLNATSKFTADRFSMVTPKSKIL